MKLSKADLDIINELIVNSKKIEDCYKLMAEGFYKETLCLIIKSLIAKEDKLIEKLELSKTKYEEIRSKLLRKYDIQDKTNMPVIACKDLNIDTYPYFRIIRKCSHRVMDADTLTVTLDDVRREYRDLETGLIYNALINTHNRALDENVKASIMEKAYFVLMDSPSTEIRLLNNLLEPTLYVVNAIRMVINCIVDKQAETISRMFAGEVVFETKENIDLVEGEDKDKKAEIEKKYAHKKGLVLLVDRETYDIRYEEVIGDRFDETFERTYKLLEKEITSIKDGYPNIMFYIALTYLKVVLSILPSERRQNAYETIEKRLIKQGVYDKYKSLYKDSVNDIESNIIEQIYTVTLNLRH